MTRRLAGTSFVAICSFLILIVSVGMVGCALPWASSPTATTISSDTVVAQVIARLQSALGLPAGAISKSSQPPLLSGSDVALHWSAGKADVDVHGGYIRAILTDSTQTTSGSTLSISELGKKADLYMGLLGWDGASLRTQGFTEGEAKMVDRGDNGAVYQKTWVGHDSNGVPNEGVIEVGLDATNGRLHSFLFDPGPATALDSSDTITKSEAMMTAKEATTSRSPSSSPTSASGPTTASSAPSGASGEGSTSTTVAPPLEVVDATLIHTNKTGITGGRDMLVWLVKLARPATSAAGGATVYVDAVSGDVLVVIAT